MSRKGKGVAVLDLVDAALLLKASAAVDTPDEAVEEVRMSVTLDVETHKALGLVASRLGKSRASAARLLLVGAIVDAFNYLDSDLQRDQTTPAEYFAANAEREANDPLMHGVEVEVAQ